jgi:predicted CoA-substrate-specific enzyme activase
MIHYVCKYTPIELFSGFGEQTVPLESMRQDYPLADAAGHMNLCGFGKSVLEAVLDGEVSSLVLVNCCDVMRHVYDIIRHSGKCSWLCLLDLPHETGECSVESFKAQLLRLKDSYASYSGKVFDEALFRSAFVAGKTEQKPYVGIAGARCDKAFSATVSSRLHMPVRNLTCLGNRVVPPPEESDIWRAYASNLLSQIPCNRMDASWQRKRIYQDPSLKAIVYHAMKFCDFSQMEYRENMGSFPVPTVRIETDYTLQADGQLSTRLEAFRETLEGEKTHGMEKEGNYVAGIDSGSTSTDVVIMDRNRKVVASVIVATGGGAEKSAEECLVKALEEAHLERKEIARVVATGYGRDYLSGENVAVTEISCHAKGARFLDSTVRTVIDIGGQDSKVISLTEEGKVANFAMNDKCAAGTGRFLEMMARTLGLTLSEMAALGFPYGEDLSISSMCTVFAESEVVSLVARNKKKGDIIHALDKSVASKIAALVYRVGLVEPCMLTGGVAQNKGVVHALEEKLHVKLVISPEAQLCGALGAALFALE